MSEKSRARINQYTNSMFRYEQLSDRWVALCARYLRSLFGDSLSGKTIVDYAFGRGNWSLAFLAIGARKVIAIDAAADAVHRFESYCGRRDLRNIEIVLGDILEQDLDVKGDFIWLYGILPNIEDQKLFLSRIKSLASGAEAQLYVYYYNADSLREFTVRTCRSIILYQCEEDFRKDSYLFVRPARLRARDDLTAPHVGFLTASQAQEALRSCGIYIQRQDRDFQEFLHGKATEDFYPHQYLCGLRSGDEIDVHEPKVPYQREIEILDEAAQLVLSLPLGKAERRNIAIGLYNTHFAFLKGHGRASNSVIEIFLFLMYIILQRGIKESQLPPALTPYYRLFNASIAEVDLTRRLQLLPAHAESGPDKLVEYLLNQNIRT
jgi:hypothetical protein